MNESNETTPLNDTKEKEKSTHMWRTNVVVSTLFGVGILISLSLFFSTVSSGGIATESSTNLVRAENKVLSSLVENHSGPPENKFKFKLWTSSNFDKLTVTNTNQQQYDISNGQSFDGFEIKKERDLVSYISVLAGRHKTHAVATSFCQKSAINNVATRMTHTGFGKRYPKELNFWVQFDTLSFIVTNSKYNTKSTWTILNFVVGQGSFNDKNNWWYGAPSCVEEEYGTLVCETTIAGHYLELKAFSNSIVNEVKVMCRVGINSKTSFYCEKFF